MTPEQAEAVLKMCRKIQHACPWARIIDEESQGIRSLYVALTRATKRVAVVHRRELPAMLQE